MKKILFLCLIFLSSFVSAQTELEKLLNKKKDSLYIKDKRVFMFKTHEDFKSNNHIYVGDYDGYIWGSGGGNIIKVVYDNDYKKINMNDYWGFILDDYVFRVSHKKPRIPVCVIKTEPKVFYMGGYFFLSYFYDGDFSSSRIASGYFYSDDMNSRVYPIEKILKKEKETTNNELKSLLKCVEKGKKRYGYQAQFNGYSKCFEKKDINE